MKEQSRGHSILEGATGGLALMLLLEVVIGLSLAGAYKPTVAEAYTSWSSLPANPRAFHFWGSSVVLAGSILLLGAMTAQRVYESSPRLWWAGTLIFLSAILGQISGAALPFDRHAAQTALIEVGIASQASGAGQAVANLMRGGAQLGDGTLANWYLMHRWILLVLIGAAVVLALGKGSRGIWKTRITWAVAMACLTVLLASVAGIHSGSPASEADFNSYDARPGWYTWPLHGALNMFAKLSSSAGWIGAILLPSLLVLLLLLAPLLARKLSGRAIQVAAGSIAAVILLGGILFGGSIAPLTGNRDPVEYQSGQAKAPTTNPQLAALGSRLFKSSTCSGCHGADGKGGFGGPSLVRVWQRHGSDPAWYERFIRSAESVKPGTTMPPFPNLKQDELRALAEFVLSVE